MEKVKLTQEQALALEAALEKESADAILKSAAREWETWFNECRALNYMDLPTMAKALYVGYEVEQPEFKAGDKVILWGRVVTLKKNREMMGAGAWSIEENNGVNIYASDLIRATPEEIYWLKMIGREKVMKFLDGDAVLFEDESISFIDFSTHRGFLKQLIKERGLKGVYPAESFIPFPKEAVK